MTKLALVPLAFLALAACDPQAMADKTTRNMAADVVRPVVGRDMPAAPAEAATQCILDAAAVEEQRALARDYGVEAGSQTRENIRNIALRPAAQSCFASHGVPPVK
ncbi:hypothetical protein [Xinfangfangia pollutisoli]|uniref:hypothetical protein n=1 Tax=Xinfangfangia pollutisoli TaxID=2865960 RepID=UPI001CD7BFE4|nr:hypothetical protein [Xinfangfangia pollutisoli]